MYSPFLVLSGTNTFLLSAMKVCGKILLLIAKRQIIPDFMAGYITGQDLGFRMGLENY